MTVRRRRDGLRLEPDPKGFTDLPMDAQDQDDVHELGELDHNLQAAESEEESFAFLLLSTQRSSLAPGKLLAYYANVTKTQYVFEASTSCKIF